MDVHLIPGYEWRDLPVPPTGFDPLAADHDTLVHYGLPHRPVDPFQRRMWEWVLGRPIEWLPVNREPTANRRPRQRGRRVQAVNPSDTATWSGALNENGPFRNVSAVWTTPEIVYPSPDGADLYSCSQWVGLDDGVPDGWLYQAGVTNTVDNTSGQAIHRFYVWSEIFLPSNLLIDGYGNQKPEPPPDPVNLMIMPGDQVAVALNMDPEDGGESGSFTVWVINLTSGQGNICQTAGHTIIAEEAAWIVERESVQSIVENKLNLYPEPLARFANPITMEWCGAGLLDKSGVADLSTAQATDMMSTTAPYPPLTSTKILSPHEVSVTWEGYY